MTTVAFVFARGGSKGIKRKNLRLLAGKPLLVHAIEAARVASLVDWVVVSTDDQEIAAVAQGMGTLVIMRPAELATDDSPEWLSWQHAIRLWPDFQRGELTTFVSVPCTAPLRLPEDIDNCIRALQGSDADAVITVTEAKRNPFFNQVMLDDGDWAWVVADMLLDGETPMYIRRQDCAQVYDVTTVCYAARPEYVLRANNLMDDRVRTIIIPPDRAIDIDTELDLRIAEMLMGERDAEARVKHCVVCGEALPLGGYFLIGPAGLSVDFCGKLECGRSVMEGQTNQ